MRDANMTNPEGLPPYEPVVKTPTARPVIVTLRRAANRHTEPDFERCDAIRIDSTTEFPALYDTFIAQVRRQYSCDETGILNGRCHLVLEDGRFIKFKHTDTWDACRDILLTRDKTELWFTFWTQEVINQEATIQQASAEVPASKPEPIHPVLASLPDLKSFPHPDSFLNPKLVKVAIRQYKPSVGLPGIGTSSWSAIATSGGSISITPVTSFKEVIAKLLTQAGYHNLTTTELHTLDSSVKSSLLLTPWISSGQTMRVYDEESWTACRKILLRDYHSLCESISPKLAFEFSVNGEYGTSCIMQ
ncbi:hypothetical protein LTR17_002525 [Elasticomyces elasticus]|nr:hypothetical protein LTR17_002525 [Elasticomyces elasticus]